MTNISYSTGVKEYVLNGDENNKIRINVTDFNIMKRWKEADEEIQKLVTPRGQRTIEEAERIDNEVRKWLNYVFNTDVCTPAFGNTSILSPLPDGRLLFQSFMEAFLPQIAKDIEAAGAASQIRLNELEQKTEKYTSQLSPEPKRNKLIQPSFNTAAKPDLTPEQKEFLKSLLGDE
jgi:hypothetical protein